MSVEYRVGKDGKGKVYYNSEYARPGFSFTDEMLAARIDGRKTMTRRLHKRPKFKIGDLIYVKESLAKERNLNTPYYVSDSKLVTGNDCQLLIDWRWQRDRLPAMFMPGIAARYFDRITEVRRERLQDISEADMVMEGINISAYVGHRQSQFITLWCSINPKRKWTSNPEVYVYAWEVVR